ncbi:MAG: DUF4340 domain-containing protein [Acidobacteria bacterium]|nr:DUF4340 domain-containing protein [Acidobacteriota bacterium]
MKELIKTGAFVMVAIALSVAASRSAPERRTAAIFSETGETFYPKYTDPSAVKTIEVVDYDESTAAARPFQVAFEKGRWILPANYNYVIDVGDRLEKTAGALVEIKKENVVGDSVSEHGKFGVIDPLDSKSASLSGRGKRVTLRDARKDILADFVLGKTVEGKPGFRYLRTPGDKRVYAVKTDADPSARFADWVNADLLRIASSTIRRVSIVSYNIDDSGRLANIDQVQITHDKNDWQIAGGGSFHKSVINAMANALDTLKITDVRPKPPSLAESLKSGKMEMSLEGMMSLRQKGYFVSPQGRLMATEGEMLVEINNGVGYTLRFGEVATTGDAKPTAPAAANENRYLFVTATFDPQRAAKYGDTSGSGEGIARDLNNRFSEWYYVIRATDFNRLRVRRKDLGLPPAAPPGPQR